MKKLLSFLAAFAMVFAMAVGFSACDELGLNSGDPTGGEETETPPVTYTKLTEEEWKTAIIGAVDSENYIMKLQVSLESSVIDEYNFEIQRDGNILHVRSGSQYSEWMYYVLNGDAIEYYYLQQTQSGNDYWVHKTATGYYGEEIKTYFNTIDYIKNATEMYDILEFDAATNTYSYDRTVSMPDVGTMTEHSIVTIENGEVKYYNSTTKYDTSELSDYSSGSTIITFGNAKISLPESKSN